MTHREGHDEIVALEPAVFLAESGQGVCDVSRDTGFLADDEGFCHRDSTPWGDPSRLCVLGPTLSPAPRG